MQTNIRYKGYTTEPSDYECADGDLSTSVGLINEDGGLKPCLSPKSLFSLPLSKSLGESDTDLIYIHKTFYYTHYLAYSKTNKTILWAAHLDEGITANSWAMLHVFEDSEIYQCTAIGNTLVILASDCMHYFLWKGDTNKYFYLGTSIPEVPLTFGLHSWVTRTAPYKLRLGEVAFPNDFFNSYFNDTVKSAATTQGLGKINTFITGNTVKNEDGGRFIFPFFVRYALRLYDGTLTHHSAPILMLASWGDNLPYVMMYNRVMNSSGVAFDLNNSTFCTIGVVSKLVYKLLDASVKTQLSNWEDIVKSVDIFISQPIYTYDQNGKVTKFVNPKTFDGYSVCKDVVSRFANESFKKNPLVSHDGLNYGGMYYNEFTDGKLSEDNWGCLQTPKVETDKVIEKLKTTSLFYLVCSIKPSDLYIKKNENEDDFTDVSIEKGILETLATREVMTDDYDSHDKLIPQFAFPYNNRLNLATMAKRLFEGFSADNFSNFVETGCFSVKTYVYIREGKGIIIVESGVGNLGYGTKLFFYYPNPNAYKAVFAREGDYTLKYLEIELSSHDTLNGAYYFGDIKNTSFVSTIDEVPIPTTGDATFIDISNKIYSSEVSNPYFFPLNGINTVGTGRIIGISTAAKALSEGQFGAFPLYAFSEEGVWALSVNSSTGGFSSVQPISRDVCINKKSITQLDNAVLFATNRGIMLISGSKTECISDTINSADPFQYAILPRMDVIIDMYNDRLSLTDVRFSDGQIAFVDFLKECRMIYDYTNQRVIVYNANVNYAYVFSLKSKKWGIMNCSIVSNVPSYTEAYAVALVRNKMSGIIVVRRQLVDFSASISTSGIGLLVTRPIKLDDPDAFKTIQTIIQRGTAANSNLIQVLYGSNDFKNWRIVSSSNNKYLRGVSGTPYKMFRIAVIFDAIEGETLTGCSIEFAPRMRNKLR